MNSTFEIWYRKLIFDTETDLNLISYFNYDTTSGTIRTKIPKKDIISVSNIKYDRNKVLTGDTLTLMKKCGNITIELGTIDNDFKNTFEVKSDFKHSLYFFYIVQDNAVIFSGTATQENVSYSEKTEYDSERIKIEIKSLLNDFLAYFKTSDIDVNSADSAGIFDRDVYNLGADYTSCYLDDFLKWLFFNNGAGFEVVNLTGYNWELSRSPFFYATNDFYLMVANGLRQVGAKNLGQDGLTITDWFVKLCNAMGWDFELVYTYTAFNPTVRLTLYNKSRIEYIISLDRADIDSIEYENQFESTVDYIVIEDGQVEGSTGYNSPNAIPIKIISESETFSEEGRFFNQVLDEGGNYSLRPHSAPNYYMVENRLPDTNQVEWGKVTYTDLNSWGSRTTERMYINNSGILKIETGSITLGAVIDMSNKVQAFDRTELGSVDYGVWYKGNYGSMIFSRDTIMDYDLWSQTSKYRDNFLTILNTGNTDILTVKLNYMLTSYFYSNYNSVMITGDTYLNQNWHILECEINPNDETTKLKLKKL